MTLYSYVVARDYGFAPNPFGGFCTLATCKPVVRRTAAVSDWVVGTGAQGYGLSGRIVFAMRVDETLDFDEYWNDPRFEYKRPSFTRSLKYAYGDNIYHRHPESGDWIQEPSHHSLPNGDTNVLNLQHDTGTNRVLVSTFFSYWGNAGPEVPARFDEVVCRGQGHKSRLLTGLAEPFLEWVASLRCEGLCGTPSEWP